MKLLRSLLLWPVWTVWTTLIFLAVLLRAPFGNARPFAFAASRVWAKGLLGVAGVRIRVRDPQNLWEGASLIVANHTSMLDILAGFGFVGKRFRYVSRPFFFKIPILGWGMSLSGHLSLDPNKPREAVHVLRRAGELLREGESILLFPEGTRSPDGNLRGYKRGPFLTAIRSGVPVQPVAFRGLHPLLPKGSLQMRPGRGSVVVGPPFPTEGLSETDAKDLASRVEAWTRGALTDGDPGDAAEER